jgi:hypothetical protein
MAGNDAKYFHAVSTPVVSSHALHRDKNAMTQITLRVIDGADRGRAFADVAVPLTIGREEGNPIQLNDERISRFHLKIQEDQHKIVLTDLQSTNGTKVNGENVQIWTLRPGDVIAVGRTVLIYGSQEEIAGRLASLRGAKITDGITLDADEYADEPSAASLDFELNFPNVQNAEAVLHTLAPPELPAALSPCQASQLGEMLLYINMRMRGLIQSVSSKGKGDQVTLDERAWQNLVDLQARLAGYLRQIGEPRE